MQERVREKEMYADKVFYVSEEEICVIEERLSELQKQDAELEILFRNKMTNLEIERQQRQQEADDKLRAEKELRKVLIIIILLGTQHEQVQVQLVGQIDQA